MEKVGKIFPETYNNLETCGIYVYSYCHLKAMTINT